MEDSSLKTPVQRPPLRQLVPAGIACAVSKQVAREGLPICMMIRDKPLNAADSGWAFLSGEEDQAYLNTDTNFLIFELNVIANSEISVLTLLNAPVGTAFQRVDPGSQWQPVSGLF